MRLVFWDRLRSKIDGWSTIGGWLSGTGLVVMAAAFVVEIVVWKHFFLWVLLGGALAFVAGLLLLVSWSFPWERRSRREA